MCDHGDTIDMQLWIPAHLSHTGKERYDLKCIDRCIAPLVNALNASGMRTIQSCCGHYSGIGSIELEDGRQIVILDTPMSDAVYKTLSVALATIERVRALRDSWRDEDEPDSVYFREAARMLDDALAGELRAALEKP